VPINAECRDTKIMPLGTDMCFPWLFLLIQQPTYRVLPEFTARPAAQLASIPSSYGSTTLGQLVTKYINITFFTSWLVRVLWGKHVPNVGPGHILTLQAFWDAGQMLFTTNYRSPQGLNIPDSAASCLSLQFPTCHHVTATSIRYPVGKVPRGSVHRVTETP
jgi:hypothetical protein